MKTIIKIAWRNIWRNKTRSGVVFASIILGIWAGLFVVALSSGMIEQQKRGIINTQISHLKIHTPAFLEDEILEHYIPDTTLDNIKSLLKQHSEAHFATRTIINATGTTAHGFSNLRIMGIDPIQEQNVTTLYQKLDTGTYFTNYKSSAVLVGRKLAESIHLGVGKTLNISFRDNDGNLIQRGFKVEGIYNTANAMFDQSHVFIQQSELKAIAGIDHKIHEVAIILPQIEETDSLVATLNQSIPTIEARSWRKLAPDLNYQDEMMGTSLMIILTIIIFALTFGIVNTMLMAVLERKRELGMLLCVGMNKTKIFLMIMIESIALSVAAAPLGLLLAWGSITYFGTNGISLLSVEDALYKFGIDTMVYTSLDTNYYFVITAMVILAAIISSVYPARKALKYNPAEAVRAI